jgi:hypothetical protein
MYGAGPGRALVTKAPGHGHDLRDLLACLAPARRLMRAGFGGTGPLRAALCRDSAVAGLA